MNLGGFAWGGPRHWWELAVSCGYLVCWALFLRGPMARWQRVTSILWWTAGAVCAGACCLVTALDLDGFLLMFPAALFLTPLSGLAFLTGSDYPVLYGLCTILAAGFGAFAVRGKCQITG